MGEGVVVAIAPTVADECGNQQQKGALGLMEVGNHSRYGTVFVAGGYHQLRLAAEVVDTIVAHPLQHIGVGFCKSDTVIIEIGRAHV